VHEKGTQTSDDPIERAEIRRALPRAIEDQQLMFDEHRGSGKQDYDSLHVNLGRRSP